MRRFASLADKGWRLQRRRIRCRSRNTCTQWCSCKVGSPSRASPPPYQDTGIRFHRVLRTSRASRHGVQRLGGARSDGCQPIEQSGRVRVKRNGAATEGPLGGGVPCRWSSCVMGCYENPALVEPSAPRARYPWSVGPSRSPRARKLNRPLEHARPTPCDLASEETRTPSTRPASSLIGRVRDEGDLHMPTMTSSRRARSVRCSGHPDRTTHPSSREREGWKQLASCSQGIVSEHSHKIRQVAQRRAKDQGAVIRGRGSLRRTIQGPSS